MLIQRLQCPNGCQNATITESIKVINTGNSNLLLDNTYASPSVQTSSVKLFTCHCCGNSFEMHQKTDDRMVL